MKIKILILVVAIIFLMPIASAAHYITGYVNDSLDGVIAEGRTVVLWNPANGINDNITDTIGVSGNSGVSNVFMFDCELLNSSCNVGNTLSVRVLDNGDGYLSYNYNIVVTGAGYDIVSPMRINSFPNSSLLSPINNLNFTYRNISFNCSASDLDNNLANISLFGNWSGGWHLNTTLPVSGGYGTVLFRRNISDGRYIWNCLAKDNVSSSEFASSNYSITVDSTPPNITSIYFNDSHSCGNGTYVRVNCTAIDNVVGVSNVTIEASRSLGKINFSAQLLSGNTYYADILIDTQGSWQFTCYSYDYFSNLGVNSSINFSVYDAGISDLMINASSINFSNLNPMERERVVVNTTVYNIGCGNARNFLVALYNGDPSSGGVMIGNQTITVIGFSSFNILINWSAEIGYNNIFSLADVNNSINESDKTNNQANRSINVNSWQVFYGNISGNKIIGGRNYNLSLWFNFSDPEGNIFITDKEADIVWSSLYPIGMNETMNASSNDFNEIDITLNSTDFNDSVNLTFTYQGIIKSNSSFIVHQRNLTNVPIINSTNNSNFITGILWDATRDTNGEYDSVDREDLVFITKINKNKQGKYGKYDYEINIPVRLRDYYLADRTDVYLYYDLV